MIELVVDEICQECEFFEPVCTKMGLGNGTVIHYVRCDSKEKCDIIKEKLEAMMRKTDEAR